MYEPTLQDVEWATQMIRINRDGAIMEFPAYKGGHRYQFDKINKRLTLLNPEVLLEFQPGFVVHVKTICVFAAVGYEVVEDPAESMQTVVHTMLNELEAKKKIVCECGNSKWDTEFVYIGAGAELSTAACRRCGNIYEYNTDRRSWVLTHRSPLFN